MNTNKIILAFIGAAVLVVAGAFMKIQHMAFAEVALLIGMVLQVFAIVLLIRSANKRS